MTSFVFKIFILIFFSCLSILSCQKHKNPLTNSPIKISDNYIFEQGIYALDAPTEQRWGVLCYSPYDSIHFIPIPDCEQISHLYISRPNNLVVAATAHKLIFVDSQQNKKVKEIVVPNTTNPDWYFGFSTVTLYPCKWNSDYCILVNWSIHLINLKTQTIEKVIWDAWKSDYDIYTRKVALNPEGTQLFLLLSLRGFWEIDENYNIHGARHRIVSIDLLNGHVQTIQEYPVSELGFKFIFVDWDYLLVNQYEKQVMFRYNLHQPSQCDSIYIENSGYFLGFALLEDKIITQDAKTRTFYLIDAEAKTYQPYFEMSKPEDITSTLPTVYQKKRGGDLIACVRASDLKKCYIINLSTRQVLIEFYHATLGRMFIY